MSGGVFFGGGMLSSLSFFFGSLADLLQLHEDIVLVDASCVILHPLANAQNQHDAKGNKMQIKSLSCNLNVAIFARAHPTRW